MQTGKQAIIVKIVVLNSKKTSITKCWENFRQGLKAHDDFPRPIPAWAYESLPATQDGPMIRKGVA